MNLLKINFFLKKYLKEFISSFIALISIIFAFIYSDKTGVVFVVSILLTILALVLTLFFFLKEKDFYFVALDNYDYKENWFGSGKFDLYKTSESYLVGDTDAGFIFSKCLLWKDYVCTADFKILNDCLGVILRASDLSNYVMLQIRKDSIRPHIRVNGGWIPFETSITGLNFEKDIKDGKWYKFEFIVKGDLIEIKVFNDLEVLINKSWKITSGIISTPVYPKEDINHKSLTHVLDITVSYDYGAIGFRNGHNERALVKNLLIKSIN